MKNVLIISATLRNNYTLANQLKDLLNELEVTPTVISLENFVLPLYTDDVFDKENILLIDYEDFKSDVASTVGAVYSFLNVSTEFSADVNKKHNTFTMPKNKLIRFMYSFVVIRNILSFIFPKNMVKAIQLSLFRKNKKPKLLEETRNQLKHYFSNDVRLLENLIGKDYSKWIK